MLVEEGGDVLERMVQHRGLLRAFNHHQRHDGDALLYERRRQVLALQADDGGGAIAPVQQLHAVAPQAEQQRVDALVVQRPGAVCIQLGVRLAAAEGRATLGARGALQDVRRKRLVREQAPQAVVGAEVPEPADTEGLAVRLACVSRHWVTCLESIFANPRSICQSPA